MHGLSRQKSTELFTNYTPNPTEYSFPHDLKSVPL